MRKLFSLIVVLFSFNLSAHAQTYVFTGDVNYSGSGSLAAAFDNATTFTATLIFDTSQTISDAAIGGTYVLGGYEYANYNIGSLTYQIGSQTWIHNGGYDLDYIHIQDGLSGNNTDEYISIHGNTNQLLSNSYTVTSDYIFARHHDYTTPPLFNGADASSLLAFNDVAAYNNHGTIFLENVNVAIGLSNITMTAAVPEPATWLMMLIGFGMVASVQRRRRRVLALQTLKAAL